MFKHVFLSLTQFLTHFHFYSTLDLADGRRIEIVIAVDNELVNEIV